MLAVAGVACLGLAVRADSEPAAASATSSSSELRTPAWSPRRVPALFVTAASAAKLRRDLPGIVAPYDACVVVDGPDGTVADLDGATPLAGASTQKLLVAATALALMGPAHRFTTRAVTTAPVQDGVLAGDLTIVGGGDPMLTSSDVAAHAPGPGHAPR